MARVPTKPKLFGLYRKSRKQTNRDASRRAKSRQYPPWSPTWRAIRRQVLDAEPLCRACYDVGIYEAATDVDHIDGDAWNNDRANLQPLCKPCHSRKTAAEQHERGRW